mmetsp:Transcript_29915/g.82131  ORF Transcript_29915/g.82131 Transcript_29915/m.82131 type:complete len:244 (-) Transcript_29915:140-871(-)
MGLLELWESLYANWAHSTLDVSRESVAPHFRHAHRKPALEIATTAFAAAPGNIRSATDHVFFDVDVDGKRLGRIQLGLFRNALPRTVDNFVHLAKCDLPPTSTGGPALCYKGSPVHRVIPGFMLQGGDITRGDGTGGQSIYGGTFADEVATNGRQFPFRHKRPFLLSMANAGPDTNGSQFFITTAKTPWLDGRHTVFGEVEDGEDVVKRIESLGSESGHTSVAVTIADSGVLSVGHGLGAEFL